MKKYLLVFLMLFAFQFGYSQTASELKSKADFKLKIGDYKGSINLYDKLIEIDPEFKDAYLNRAKAKLAIKRNRDAFSDASIAIKLNMKSYDALIFYSRMCLADSIYLYEDAVKAAGLAEELEPNSIEAKICGGIALIYINDKISDVSTYKAITQILNEAIQLSKSLNMKESEAEAYLYLGIMASSMFFKSNQEGLRSAALTAFQKVIEIDAGGFGLKASELILKLNRY